MALVLYLKKDYTLNIWINDYGENCLYMLENVRYSLIVILSKNFFKYNLLTTQNIFFIICSHSFYSVFNFKILFYRSPFKFNFFIPLYKLLYKKKTLPFFIIILY